MAMTWPIFAEWALFLLECAVLFVGTIGLYAVAIIAEPINLVIERIMRVRPPFSQQLSWVSAFVVFIALIFYWDTHIELANKPTTSHPYVLSIDHTSHFFLVCVQWIELGVQWVALTCVIVRRIVLMIPRLCLIAATVYAFAFL